MAIYHVTPTSPRVPAARFVAADAIELGNQVANHFARHKHLRRGLHFEAQIGNEVGAIRQAGLPKPLTFTIRKES